MWIGPESRGGRVASGEHDTFAHVDAVTALITFAAGLGGVILGGWLARRNEKKAQGERLLVQAMNDAATAIAEVASGEGKAAQNRYASAVSRIALHASPDVISRFRSFQDDATTSTADGRRRLIDAVQEARKELGHGTAPSDDIAVLLFGSSEPLVQFCASCGTVLSPGERVCAACGGTAEAHADYPEPSR